MDNLIHEDLKAKIRKLKEDCPEFDNNSRQQYLNRDITKLIELTDLIAFLLNNVKVELEDQIADTIHISMTLSGLAIDVENYKGESEPRNIFTIFLMNMCCQMKIFCSLFVVKHYT